MGVIVDSHPPVMTDTWGGGGDLEVACSAGNVGGSTGQACSLGGVHGQSLPHPRWGGGHRLALPFGDLPHPSGRQQLGEAGVRPAGLGGRLAGLWRGFAEVCGRLASPRPCNVRRPMILAREPSEEKKTLLCPASHVDHTCSSCAGGFAVSGVDPPPGSYGMQLCSVSFSASGQGCACLLLCWSIKVLYADQNVPQPAQIPAALTTVGPCNPSLEFENTCILLPEDIRAMATRCNEMQREC